MEQARHAVPRGDHDALPGRAPRRPAVRPATAYASMMAMASAAAWIISMPRAVIDANMLRRRISTPPAAASAVLGQRVQRLTGQHDARSRARAGDAAVEASRLERGGVLHVMLLEGRFPVARIDSSPPRSPADRYRARTARGRASRASADRARSRAGSKADVQRTVSCASLRACSSAGSSARIRSRVGVRVKPPTRRLTGCTDASTEQLRGWPRPPS